MVGYSEHGYDLQVRQNVGNFLNKWENISFSRRTLLHELLILLNAYNLKCQFIIARWVLAFCVSIWTHLLFTTFHNKTYLIFFILLNCDFLQLHKTCHYHCQYRIIGLRNNTNMSKTAVSETPDPLHLQVYYCEGGNHN